MIMAMAASFLKIWFLRFLRAARKLVVNCKLGFGYSSRQDAKSAKFGQHFFLKNFAASRLCERFSAIGYGSAAMGSSW
jgi:hypothetical protein